MPISEELKRILLRGSDLSRNANPTVPGRCLLGIRTAVVSMRVPPAQAGWSLCPGGRDDHPKAVTRLHDISNAMSVGLHHHRDISLMPKPAPCLQPRGSSSMGPRNIDRAVLRPVDSRQQHHRPAESERGAIKPRRDQREALQYRHTALLTASGPASLRFSGES